MYGFALFERNEADFKCPLYYKTKMTMKEDTNMWTRRELTERAQIAFKKNYWLYVVVCLVLAIVGGTGGSTSSFSGFNNTEHSSETTVVDSDWEDDYDITTSSDTIGMTDALFAGLFVGVAAIVMIIVLIVIVVALLFQIFITNPIIVGANRFFMHGREDRGNFGEIAYVFTSGAYWNVVKTMFLMQAKIFLWSLLFVIPGIVKSYEYRMIPYILSENPQIDSKRAFELTKNMTDGQKGSIWVLDLSFIGWDLLTLCCFVGIFWVNPYKQATYAELYATLRENAIKGGYSRAGELEEYYCMAGMGNTYTNPNTNFYYGNYGDASSNNTYQQGNYNGTVNLNKDTDSNNPFMQ